jgi:hypothetical protein
MGSSAKPSIGPSSSLRSAFTFGLMICAGEGPLEWNDFPVLGNTLPCFLAQNSLFDCLGKLGQRGRNTETTKQCRRCEGPSFRKFPCIFPC